jgi:hypothetical protein
MPYLACLGCLLFLVLVLLMISVMLVSWANTLDCLSPAHRVVQNFFFDLMHLDLWTSLVVVCLILNITWSFLMVSLIICGPFRLN